MLERDFEVCTYGCGSSCSLVVRSLRRSGEPLSGKHAQRTSMIGEKWSSKCINFILNPTHGKPIKWREVLSSVVKACTPPQSEDSNHPPRHSLPCCMDSRNQSQTHTLHFNLFGNITATIIIIVRSMYSARTSTGQSGPGRPSSDNASIHITGEIGPVLVAACRGVEARPHF